MPFIPHTPDDEAAMLRSIGVPSIETLFDEIPENLASGELIATPPGISEMELMQLMIERARQDEAGLCFIGAGAYEHHIPAAVWDLAGRGEFMTAYTPYQAEASQGTLQLIYEFQTMMSRLMDLSVTNASVYDGASALAEAILMAIRANKKNKSRTVAIAGDTNPAYIETCRSIVSHQGIEIVLIDWDRESGLVGAEAFGMLEDLNTVVVSYPSFFGGIGDVDAVTDWAHDHGALVVGVVNPTAMALLKPPGSWGEKGADIAVGEGQPLGIPMASGGPYLGFMCCKQEIVRQMPGRIIGRTIDQDGKDGFTLTLQAREQHIRRAKATSNICTNQGLLVTAATIYLSLLGDQGLRSVASLSVGGLNKLLGKLTQISGVTKRFDHATFHEAVIRLPMPANRVLEGMARRGVLGGYDLGRSWSILDDCVLVNVTETKSEADLLSYEHCLVAVLEELGC